MLFFGICRAIIPFFFSLLKRKKEAKKEKFSPTLVCGGNALHERKYYFWYAQHKSPGGVVGGLSAVTLPFSLRFIGGVRLSGEHAAENIKKQNAKEVL